MSFSFISKPPISFDELMGGALTAYGIEAVQTDTTGLQGPDCFVHVYGQPGGDGCSFCAYGLGGNNVLRIADAIRDHFGVDLISEHDERYRSEKGIDRSGLVTDEDDNPPTYDDDIPF